jgi:hypothetical protein
MRVLLLTTIDHANTGWRYSQCLRLLGYDVVAKKGHSKLVRGKTWYPKQMETVREWMKTHYLMPQTNVSCVLAPELAPVAEKADVIHYLASSFVNVGMRLSKKKVVVNHNGSVYRDNPELVSKFFNSFVDRSIVQTASLLGLGAKNEILVISPVDVNAIKPTIPLVGGPQLVFGHFPTSVKTKGTKNILPVLQKFSEKGVIKYIGKKTLNRPQLVTWGKQLLRVSKCDVVVETLNPTIRGKPAGGWGNSALEVAASGKVVIANYRQQDVYEGIYGEIPFLIANDPEQLEARIDQLLSMSEAELIELKERHRNWAVTKHSLQATAERLRDEVYSKFGG